MRNLFYSLYFVCFGRDVNTLEMKFNTLGSGYFNLEQICTGLNVSNQFTLETHPHSVWYIYIFPPKGTANQGVSVSMGCALQMAFWKSQRAICVWGWDSPTAVVLVCLWNSVQVRLVQPGQCGAGWGTELRGSPCFS